MTVTDREEPDMSEEGDFILTVTAETAALVRAEVATFATTQTACGSCFQRSCT